MIFRGSIYCQVSQMSSWHARAAILAYLQVAIFCNLFTLQRPDVVAEIKELVLRLLCDDQLEVYVVFALCFCSNLMQIYINGHFI